MLDLNTIRADFAAFLAANAATKHSLDAALMYVVEMAYQQGMAEGIEIERAACVALCQERVEYPAGHGGLWEGYGPLKSTRSGAELALLIGERP